MLEATATIRDALVERVEPVYGLTTLHASLKSFMAEAPPTDMQEEKQQSYAYGLMGLAKFMKRLPAEILEDELPRLKQTLASVMTIYSTLQKLSFILTDVYVGLERFTVTDRPRICSALHHLSTART